MRQHNFQHRLEAAAFFSQPMLRVNRHVMEPHRSAGVPRQTQSLKPPEDLQALGALVDQEES